MQRPPAPHGPRSHSVAIVGVSPHDWWTCLKIDTTGWTPADVALYPAICAVAAERVPSLHQLLKDLSDLHAGDRLLKLQQAGNYTQLHSVFHSDPACSVGNYNLALVGAWLALQLHSILQNVTKVGDMVEGWLAHLRAGGTIDAEAISDLFVQTVELVKPMTTLAGQSPRAHGLLEWHHGPAQTLAALNVFAQHSAVVQTHLKAHRAYAVLALSSQDKGSQQHLSGSDHAQHVLVLRIVIRRSGCKGDRPPLPWKTHQVFLRRQ